MVLRINNETVTMCSRLSYRPGPCSGQHDRSRTISSPNQRSTKSRIALMAAAIGAVSTAGGYSHEGETPLGLRGGDRAVFSSG